MNRRYGKKKPERAGSLNTLGGILPDLCRELDWDRKVNEMAFLRLWKPQAAACMGADSAAQTQAIKLRKQGARVILMVKVAHAVLASELSFYTQTLRDALNQFEPQTGVKIHQIQWIVGSLSD